jgi:hypothetical protein
VFSSNGPESRSDVGTCLFAGRLTVRPFWRIQWMRHSPVRKTRKKVVNCRDAREEDQQEKEHPMNKQKETKTDPKKWSCACARCCRTSRFFRRPRIPADWRPLSGLWGLIPVPGSSLLTAPEKRTRHFGDPIATAESKARTRPARRGAAQRAITGAAHPCSQPARLDWNCRQEVVSNATRQPTQLKSALGAV